MNPRLSPCLRLGAMTVCMLLVGCGDDDSTGPGPVQGRTMYAADNSNQLRDRQ